MRALGREFAGCRSIETQPRIDRTLTDATVVRNPHGTGSEFDDGSQGGKVSLHTVSTSTI